MFWLILRTILEVFLGLEVGCANARLGTLLASFLWNTHKPPCWNQSFPPCLAEKASFNDKSVSLPRHWVWNYLEPRFRPIWANESWKCQFLPKTRLRCPCDALRRPATSCDVFCDACDVVCDALRRFLRRPATSCDVFWWLLADFAIFGHIFPIFWKITYDVPKFQVSCLVSPRFGENLDKEVYGKDYVAEQFGRIKLSHFDDVFVLFHDLLDITSSQLSEITTRFFFNMSRQSCFNPGFLDLSQWLPCKRKMKVWGGGGYMLDVLWRANARGTLVEIEEPQKGQ